VNKWRVISIDDGNGPSSDSVVALLHIEIEFTKDGRFIIESADTENPQSLQNSKGTYTLSKDNKRITLYSNRIADTNEILELSSSKITIKALDYVQKLTAIPSSDY
jgi:hypothetical protein